MTLALALEDEDDGDDESFRRSLRWSGAWLGGRAVDIEEHRRTQISSRNAFGG